MTPLVLPETVAAPLVKLIAVPLPKAIALPFLSVTVGFVAGLGDA
jgi:hypothetical protein